MSERLAAMKLLFATRNAGKVRELERLVAPLGHQVITLDQAGVSGEVEEDAPSFLGNAEKKARAGLAATGLPTVADDSGLEVDALDGAPGVRSARYAGRGHDDQANLARLLEVLTDVPDELRTARFRCALVYVDSEGSVLTAEGTCEGRILRAPRGSGGFGYDPIFQVAGDERSMAELSLEEKNRVSHRARALARLANALASRERTV